MRHIAIIIFAGALLALSTGCTTIYALHYVDINENAKSPVIIGSVASNAMTEGVPARVDENGEPVAESEQLAWGKGKQVVVVGNDLTALEQIDTSASLHNLRNLKNSTSGGGLEGSTEGGDIQDDDKVEVSPDVEVDAGVIP